MHGLCAGAHSGLDHRRDVQVALPGRSGPQQDGHIGLCDVTGTGIGLAVHRDGTDAHAAQGADDPHGDLATVGDQYCVEHATHILKTP